MDGEDDGKNCNRSILVFLNTSSRPEEAMSSVDFVGTSV